MATCTLARERSTEGGSELVSREARTEHVGGKELGRRGRSEHQHLPALVDVDGPRQGGRHDRRRHEASR